MFQISQAKKVLHLAVVRFLIDELLFNNETIGPQGMKAEQGGTKVFRSVVVHFISSSRTPPARTLRSQLASKRGLERFRAIRFTAEGQRMCKAVGTIRCTFIWLIGHLICTGFSAGHRGHTPTIKNHQDWHDTAAFGTLQIPILSRERFQEGGYTFRYLWSRQRKQWDSRSTGDANMLSRRAHVPLQCIFKSRILKPGMDRYRRRQTCWTMRHSLSAYPMRQKGGRSTPW